MDHSEHPSAAFLWKRAAGTLKSHPTCPQCGEGLPARPAQDISRDIPAPEGWLIEHHPWP